MVVNSIKRINGGGNEYQGITNFQTTRIQPAGQARGHGAIVSGGVVSTPKVAHGDYEYSASGDQSWFNTPNWFEATTSTTGTLPEVGFIAGVTNTTNLDAHNVSMPSVGVLFDPANDALTPGGENANYLANLDAENNFFLGSTFYVSNAAFPTDFTSSSPNKLTIESGTLEAGVVSVGRDGPGMIVQNGGTFISDYKLNIQDTSRTQTIGSGTFEYHGGTLIAGNAVRLARGETASSNIGAMGLTSAGVGKLVIYNNGPDGAILISNGITVAANTQAKGTIGIVEFHYDLNPEGVGNTRPIQNDFNTTNGVLALDNGANTSSRLNLVLDAAPTPLYRGTIEDPIVLSQNLGLFKNQSSKGIGTFPRLFYSTDGLTAYTQGATISASFLFTTYSWTISYSGLITFDNTATSAYSSGDISATGGSDIVLIGGLPEPGSAVLLGGVGSMILSRRRKRA
jgi:hypothetical protein